MATPSRGGGGRGGGGGRVLVVGEKGGVGVGSNRKEITKKATTATSNPSHTKKTPTSTTTKETPAHPHHPTSSTSKTSKTHTNTAPSTSPPSSNSEEKPVPNYLKPTISSSLDLSRAKRSETSTTNKPVHNRRISIDKPPYPAQPLHLKPTSIHVSHAHASNSNSNSNSGRTTSRSTSFCGSRPITNKVMERSLSSQSLKSDPAATTAPRGSSLRSRDRAVRPTRRSSSVASAPSLAARKTRTTTTSSSISAAKSVTSESSTTADHLEIMHDDDDDIDDHKEVSSPSLLSLDHHQQLQDHQDETTAYDLPDLSEMPGKDETLGDPSPSPSPHPHPSVNADIVAAESDQNKVKKINVVAVEPEEQLDKEVNDDAEKQQLGDVANKVEVEKKEQAKDIEVVEEHSPAHHVPDLEKATEEPPAAVKEQKEEEQEATNSNLKGDITSTVVTPIKKPQQQDQPTTSTVVTPSKKPQPQAAGAGAKKEAQVYNEVIEETASKLMKGGSGDRRNKVLALAGAFQTVINLQDSKN